VIRLPEEAAPPPLGHPSTSPPALDASRLTLPLSVPVALLQQMLQQAAPQHESTNWQRVSEKGASPEVEARFEVQADPVVLESDGDALTATLPLRYHGALRARAKTPFGWVWLTQNTPYGSASAPGRIELKVRATLTVSEHWALSTHSELIGVKLKAPPVDKLCTSGALTICIPANEVTARVNAELDRRIRREAARALRDADAQIAKRVPLRELAETLWKRLQAEQAGLWLDPRALALHAPVVRDDSLILQVRLRAMPQLHAPGEVARSALPPPEALEKQRDVLHFDAPLTWQAWSDALRTRELATSATSGEAMVSTLIVRGPAPTEGRVWLASSLAHGGDTRTLHVTAKVVSDGQRVWLSDGTPTEGSRALLQSLGIEEGPFFVNLLEATQVDVSPMLEARVEGVRRALSASVMPLPTTPLRDAQCEVRSAFVTPDAVVLRARAY